MEEIEIVPFAVSRKHSWIKRQVFSTQARLKLAMTGCDRASIGPTVYMSVSPPTHYIYSIASQSVKHPWVKYMIQRLSKCHWALDACCDQWEAWQWTGPLLPASHEARHPQSVSLSLTSLWCQRHTGKNRGWLWPQRLQSRSCLDSTVLLN